MSQGSEHHGGTSRRARDLKITTSGRRRWTLHLSEVLGRSNAGVICFVKLLEGLTYSAGEDEDGFSERVGDTARLELGILHWCKEFLEPAAVSPAANNRGAGTAEISCSSFASKKARLRYPPLSTIQVVLKKSGKVCC